MGRPIEVGDRIYFSRYSHLDAIQTVVKVTATMIKAKGYNLKGDSDHLRVLGQGKWYTTSAHLETPELKAQWEDQQLQSWISANWQKIPLDIVAEIKERMAQ